MRANRTSVVALALALALAGTLVGALVERPVGAATANPVKIVSGYANGPEAMPNSMTQIRSLKVPKGIWAIGAKLFVEGGAYAHCVLIAGVDNDNSKVGLDGTSGKITGTIYMSVVHEFRGSKGHAKVRCTDQGGTMNWWYLKITAVSGGSLQNTHL